MEAHRLEVLFEAFLSKRLESLDYACDGSPLSCLNSNELSVLQILADQGELVMSSLSEISTLAMSTLTGITDKLRSKGLLTRNRNPEDRRIVRVALSPAGQKALHIRIEAKNEVCRDILSGLTEEEKTQFLSLLEKIVNN